MIADKERQAFIAWHAVFPPEVTHHFNEDGRGYRHDPHHMMQLVWQARANMDHVCQ